MKTLCLWIVLTLAVIAIPARAFSPLIEINPKWERDLSLGFEIHSELLTDGNVEFTVKISERSLKFREHWSTSLSKVHVTDHSMESSGLRKLRADRAGDTITCVFTVTPNELEDPDVSFYFGMPVPGHPNIDHFYAPLKNFLPK